MSSSRPAKTAIRLSQRRTEQEEEEEGEKFFQVVGPLLTPPSDLLHTITMVYLFRHALAFWVAFFWSAMYIVAMNRPENFCTYGCE